MAGAGEGPGLMRAILLTAAVGHGVASVCGAGAAKAGG